MWVIKSLWVLVSWNSRKRRYVTITYDLIADRYNVVKDALKVIKTLQNAELDGHALALKFSHKRVSTEEKIKRKSTSDEPPTSKLIVRNIAFEGINSFKYANKE